MWRRLSSLMLGIGSSEHLKNCVITGSKTNSLASHIQRARFPLSPHPQTITEQSDPQMFFSLKSVTIARVIHFDVDERALVKHVPSAPLPPHTQLIPQEEHMPPAQITCKGTPAKAWN